MTAVTTKAVALALIVLMLSCKQEEPALYSPSIESISFADIPSQNVELNRVHRLITLTMPATLTSLQLKTSIRLTPNTEIVSGLLPDGTLDLSGYCPCPYANSGNSLASAREIVLRNTLDDKSLSYRLVLKAEKPLTIKPSPTPLTYSISDKTMHGVVVPVENYYGSQSIRSYKLTNTTTGKSASTSGDGSCLSDCSLVGLNRMFIYLNFFLRDYPYGFGPGTYTIAFTLTDGTVVSVPQPINVIP